MKTFLARQPIFNRHQRVIGYELLFRSGPENFFAGPEDHSRASSIVMVESFLMPQALSLTSGKKAFINVTRETLLDESIYLFPPEIAVVELLEIIRPDEEVLRACRKLKERGYTIALDDYIDDDCMAPLLELADIVKVDFVSVLGDERRKLAEKLARPGLSLLAEKVETVEDFEAAKLMGYTYFQGYFFARPSMLTRTEPPSEAASYFRLIKEIHQPELDYLRIEKVLRGDPTLSYKLLRYINAVAFGARCEITSIIYALSVLGEALIRKWVTVVALVGMSGEGRLEAVRSSVIRGTMCEAVARSSGLLGQAESAYFLGLFSMIDALLERPMEVILDELPLAFEIKAALMGQQNQLWAVLQYVIAYEQGEWKAAEELADSLGIKEGLLPQVYTSAIEESDLYLTA
jgi:c-di-GMP-related signal transduction protein